MDSIIFKTDSCIKYFCTHVLNGFLIHFNNFAGMFGFTEAKLLEVETPEMREAPKVSF